MRQQLYQVEQHFHLENIPVWLHDSEANSLVYYMQPIANFVAFLLYQWLIFTLITNVCNDKQYKIITFILIELPLCTMTGVQILVFVWDKSCNTISTTSRIIVILISNAQY